MTYKLTNTGNGFKLMIDQHNEGENLLTDIETVTDRVIINYNQDNVKLKKINVIPNGSFKKKKIGIGLIGFPNRLELVFCDKAGFLTPDSKHLVHPTDFFTIEIEQKNDN